tara:strand:- start:45 stop:713 length:669 start_codon:yes stop_codon:yes gene_type:complete
MFERCPRKWWWRYSQKIPMPPTAAMTLGTQVHKHIEDSLLGLAPIPDDSIAKSAEPFLQKSLSSSLLVEQAISMPVDDTGVKFVGRADIIDLGGAVPRVIDIKTSSNVSRWAASPSKLSNDVQMNVYAYAVLAEHANDADAIEVSHLYVQTRGSAKSKFVPVLLTRAHVESMWDYVKSTVRRMMDIYDEEFQNEIQANDSACRDYGGCPYANHCIAAKPRRK